MAFLVRRVRLATCHWRSNKEADYVVLFVRIHKCKVLYLTMERARKASELLGLVETALVVYEPALVCKPSDRQ